MLCLNINSNIAANLSGANLSNTDLSHETLINADLNGADLTNADLSRTHLTGADLSDAILVNIKAENLYNCPSSLPEGWVCKNKNLIFQGLPKDAEISQDSSDEIDMSLDSSEETVEEIDFGGISFEDLPVKVGCPAKDKDLVLRVNKKKGKYVVKLSGKKGERFYRDDDFSEAVETFEETLEDEC